jgi:hypothetical protein
MGPATRILVILVAIVLLVILVALAWLRFRRTRKHPDAREAETSAACHQEQGLFTLDADGSTLTRGVSVPDVSAPRVLVVVHGYDGAKRALMPLAQFYQDARQPSGEPYYDVVVLAQFDSLHQRVPDIAYELVRELRCALEDVPDARVDLAAHSMGAPVVRWAVEQVVLRDGYRLGSQVGALFLFSGANYCVPNTAAFPVGAIVMGAIAFEMPDCPAALTPVSSLDEIGCSTGTACDRPTCFTRTLNGEGSPFSGSVKYYAMAGTVSKDGPHGNPLGPYVHAVYRSHGQCPDDGVVWVDCALGVGVLDSKSDFLAMNESLARRRVPRDHLTIVGQYSDGTKSWFGEIPADVQAIIMEWLASAFS